MSRNIVGWELFGERAKVQLRWVDRDRKCMAEVSNKISQLFDQYIRCLVFGLYYLTACLKSIRTNRRAAVS
jgi:hypothetical protein